jgi:hypothetical protein
MTPTCKPESPSLSHSEKASLRFFLHYAEISDQRTTIGIVALWVAARMAHSPSSLNCFSRAATRFDSVTAFAQEAIAANLT